MSVRFFVDENDLALGKALGAIHGSVVYPGHEDLPEVPRQTLDEVWLPLIGSSGLIVITRDQRIRYRPVEKQLWVAHRVRGFVLTGRRSQSTVDSLEVIAEHWAAMRKLIEAQAEGPWMFAVTSDGLRAIDL